MLYFLEKKHPFCHAGFTRGNLLMRIDQHAHEHGAEQGKSEGFFYANTDAALEELTSQARSFMLPRGLKAAFSLLRTEVDFYEEATKPVGPLDTSDQAMSPADMQTNVDWKSFDKKEPLHALLDYEAHERRSRGAKHFFLELRESTVLMSYRLDGTRDYGHGMMNGERLLWEVPAAVSTKALRELVIAQRIHFERLLRGQEMVNHPTKGPMNRLSWAAKFAFWSVEVAILEQSELAAKKSRSTV